MRVLELQLGSLRVQKAQGANVDDKIADTLIAMLKDSYVRGDIDIQHLESVVAHILRGGDVVMLQPGERVLSPNQPEGETDQRRTATNQEPT